MESDSPLNERLCMPAKWTHPLPFMMTSEDKFGTEEELEPELVDLMSISEITYKGTYRHYFPSKYKPSDPAGHKLLADDLRSAGAKMGVQFTRHGGGPKKGVYPMVCHCGVYRRANAAAKGGTKTEDVAGFTYKSDIKVQSLVNHSATGEPLLKKCRTSRPKKGSETCKARLTFYPDQKHDRFSIKAYNGQRFHNDHHQLKSTEIPIVIEDLRVETVKLGQSMPSTDINLSSVRNLNQYGVALNGDPSPVIGKSHHQHPESPVIQSLDVLPPPDFPSQEDLIDDHHHHQDGEASEPMPNDSAQKNTFSQDDSRDQEFKEHLADISRLSEGHEYAEEFVSWAMVLFKGVLTLVLPAESE
jgi:hypothetical protein